MPAMDVSLGSMRRTRAPYRLRCCVRIFRRCNPPHSLARRALGSRVEPMFLLIGRSRHTSIENIAQLLETASEDSALITLEALHQVFQASTLEFLDPCARLCAQVYVRKPTRA